MERADRDAGTPTAGQVLRDHAPRVYGLAWRMLGNEADAEDVTQDVMLQVVRKLGTFRGDAALTTWLHRLTVNAALAHRAKRSRRERRRSHEPAEELAGDAPRPGGRWTAPPEQQALDEEARRVIEGAIAGLPEGYRDVYVLADVEGMANAEIGELLGLGLAAVKSRLHRARLMMREALAPHFEERT